MLDLPEAIAARWPWPSDARIDELFRKGLLPGPPDTLQRMDARRAYLASKSARMRDISACGGSSRALEMMEDEGRFTVWSACPITIRAAAILPPAELARLAAWLTPQTPFQEEFAARRPDPADPAEAHLLRLWDGVDSLGFIAWTDTRFIADIRMTPAASGATVRYVDRSLSLGGTLPDAMINGLAGRPMTGMLPHPIFEGLHWSHEQPSDLYVQGPTQRLDLGPQPGRELARLARAVTATMPSAPPAAP